MKTKFALIGAGIVVILLAVILTVNIRPAKADDGGSAPNAPPCWDWNYFSADFLSFNRSGVPYSGDEITITPTICDWSLESHESWISVSPDSGTGGATATVSVMRNNTGSNRVGWIHVYNHDEKIATLFVVQSCTLYWLSYLIWLKSLFWKEYVIFF